MFRSVSLVVFLLIAVSFTVNAFMRRSLLNRKTHQLTPLSATGGTGLHGDQFKYLPILQGKYNEFFPRIVPIAGVFPGVTYEQLMAPTPNEYAPPGTWVYDFPDPDAPQLGTVAFPGNLRVAEAFDPVALISTNTALNIPCVEEVEVVLLVDRGDKRFKSDQFFLFRDPHGEMIIRWMEKLDPNYEILGRIEVCMMPWTEAMGKPATGWEEVDE